MDWETRVLILIMIPLLVVLGLCIWYHPSWDDGEDNDLLY